MQQIQLFIILIYLYSNNKIKQNKIKHHMKKMKKSDISLVTPDKIRRHQANTSPSKYSCGFSKQKRFTSLDPYCKKSAYSGVGSQLSKVKFKVPQGKRSDFTKTVTCSPPSTKYLFESQFKKDFRKGKSFAISRESSPDRSYIDLKLAKVPSPTAYKKEEDHRTKTSYSLRKKTSDFIGDRFTYKQVPGPGKYQQPNLNPEKGRFRLSKYGDTKFATMQMRALRFKNQIRLSPGPGQYSRQDNFSNQGSYILSHHKGEGRRPFNMTARTNFTEKFKDRAKQLPGPGQYDAPSDFGVYGDHRYYKSFNSTIS